MPHADPLQATLTALAALAFQRDEIRRAIVDATSPALLPLIVPSLTASDLGIRVAACRLVRALSRSISILRTSLVDVGVADQLIRILKDDAEDAEVKQEATATICNLVLKFAPMKQLLVDGGGVAKLIELAQSAASGGMRLNALWALKNILWSSETETKRALLDTLGWDYVAELALDTAGTDEAAQEQALSIMRNVASSREADIDLTLRGFGTQRLLDLLEAVVWQKRGSAITEQAAYVLVNLATGSESHRRSIIDRPNLIEALLYFLTHKTAEIRLASVWAALNLTIRTSRTSTSEFGAPRAQQAHRAALGDRSALTQLCRQATSQPTRSRACARSSTTCICDPSPTIPSETSPTGPRACSPCLTNHSLPEARLSDRLTTPMPFLPHQLGARERDPHGVTERRCASADLQWPLSILYALFALLQRRLHALQLSLQLGLSRRRRKRTVVWRELSAHIARRYRVAALTCRCKAIVTSSNDSGPFCGVDAKE
jgi:hypothetical protein